MPRLSKSKLVQGVVVLAQLFKDGKIPKKAYERGLSNIKKELDAFAASKAKARLTVQRSATIESYKDELTHGYMSATEFVAYLHVLDHDSGRSICSLCAANSCPRRNLIA